MKRLGTLVLIVLVAALGAACSDETPPEDHDPISRGAGDLIVVEAGEPIVVGVSVALTGSAAVRGRQYADAVVLAVDEWVGAHGGGLAGHSVAVVLEDDGCTAEDIAAQAAERHSSRAGLVGVIGPQCSSGAIAAAPIYAAAGLVAISGSATASSITDEAESDLFFRTAYRNDYQGVLVGIYAEQLGFETAVVIDDGEAYGTDLASSADSALREVDVEVTRASIAQGQVDFSELAAQVASAGPDLVYFAGFNPEAALVLRQLRDAGWAGEYTSGDAVCGGGECEFLATLGELAEGVAFSGCAVPTSAAFDQRFADVHGAPPSASFVPQFYDAARLLLDSVAVVVRERDDGQLTLDPSELRATVASATLSGVSGEIQFDSKGDRTSVILGERPSTADPETLTLLASALGLVPCYIEGGAIAYFDDEGS